MQTPTLPSNRSFGFLFTVVFAIAGAYFWFKQHTGQSWFFAAAAAFTLLITLTVPGWLTPFNRAWMKLAEILNRIVSPLVLGIIFFGVFTPIAWCMRLAGRDALKRRWDAQAHTYWQERDPPGPAPDSLNNQF